MNNEQIDRGIAKAIESYATPMIIDILEAMKEPEYRPTREETIAFLEKIKKSFEPERSYECGRCGKMGYKDDICSCLEKDPIREVYEKWKDITFASPHVWEVMYLEGWKAIKQYCEEANG